MAEACTSSRITTEIIPTGVGRRFLDARWGDNSSQLVGVAKEGTAVTTRLGEYGCLDPDTFGRPPVVATTFLLIALDGGIIPITSRLHHCHTLPAMSYKP